MPAPTLDGFEQRRAMAAWRAAPRRDRTTIEARNAAVRLKRRSDAYHDTRQLLDRRRALMMAAAWRIVRQDRTLSLGHVADLCNISVGTLHHGIEKLEKAQVRRAATSSESPPAGNVIDSA